MQIRCSFHPTPPMQYTPAGHKVKYTFHVVLNCPYTFPLHSLPFNRRRSQPAMSSRRRNVKSDALSILHPPNALQVCGAYKINLPPGANLEVLKVMRSRDERGAHTGTDAIGKKLASIHLCGLQRKMMPMDKGLHAISLKWKNGNSKHAVGFF
jgi:hypothetical protein